MVNRLKKRGWTVWHYLALQLTVWAVVATATIFCIIGIGYLSVKFWSAVL